MPLNQSSIFPAGKQTNIVFNWADTQNATGYIIFDGVGGVDSVGIDYFLIPSATVNSLASDNSIKEYNSAQTTFADGLTKGIDLDFNTSEYQLPQTLKGLAYIRAEWKTQAYSANATSYVIIKVRKWNGVAETEIASVQSATMTTATNSTTSYGALLQLTIPKTIIKKGEQIRITAEVWQNVAAPGVVETWFKFDPEDTGSNSRFQMAIPFRMEI